jgi:HEAT repeat protein
VNATGRTARTIRWILSIALVALGLSTTWAWGQVAHMAEPLNPNPEPQPAVLYAAWQPAGAEHASLFRSLDGAATWQQLGLPEEGAPVAWAHDEGTRVAVALDNGSLLSSADRGHTWSVVTRDVQASSLAWADGTLVVGMEDGGLYRLLADGRLESVGRLQQELTAEQVLQLDVVDGRLFALTSHALFQSDDGGETWARFVSVPRAPSALSVPSKGMVYVGTEVEGIFVSADMGQTWRAAQGGLGTAPGLGIQVTALRADPEEPGVLYTAVNYVTGATQLHTSAAGTWVTVDGGALWQPLAGPGFPEAEEAQHLVVAGTPLRAEAVTASGLQSYGPDVAQAVADLEDADARVRAAAARILGLAGAEETTGALVAALADPDPAVSLAASQALGRINDADTVSALLVALEHPSEMVRLGAARALGMMGVDAAVPALRAMVLRGDGTSLSVAAEALGRISSPAAADSLIVALSDAEMTPRRHAALGALEAMGASAVEPLIGALQNEDHVLRANAAQALGWIGSPAATDALVRALRGDEVEAVREQAAWALGEIGDPAARAALERAQVRDVSASVQAEAARALPRLRESSPAAARWVQGLADALHRLQPLRWLVLGLSLAGAAWLGLGRGRLSPLLAEHARHR